MREVCRWHVIRGWVDREEVLGKSDNCRNMQKGSVSMWKAGMRMNV